MTKYEVIIYWNEKDNVFVAEMPELKGCIAHGETHNEALKELNIVAKEWLKLAKKEGWQIPEPKGRLVYA
jgi:predicted RNase H-like HicB family nuclease